MIKTVSLTLLLLSLSHTRLNGMLEQRRLENQSTQSQIIAATRDYTIFNGTKSTFRS